MGACTRPSPSSAALIASPTHGDRHAATPPCEGFFHATTQQPAHTQRTRHEPGHRSPAPHGGERATYDIAATETKWQQVWEELDPFRADDDSPREKRYALTMFPYPSGDLHMGHAEVFALHDVVARYWWQRGYEVLNPMGFDSFGLPAENAAIRNDEHPDTYTRANIAKSIESCKRYAASFDWSRTFNTSDPEYYRWTQWLFLKFYERGLAYRKNSAVNWCPQDQTVLANEQVVAGACERCGAEVTKKELTQWYFKITDYAQELLDGLDELESTWPDRVVTAQRNWIGRSEGAHVTFTLSTGHDIDVYTTRPDTLYGATFMVVAADAALAAEIVHPDRAEALEDYLVEVRKASDIDRLATDRPSRASTWASPRPTRSPVRRSRCGRATTCWPTTARARSWPCPRTTSATWTSRGRWACRCAPSSTSPVRTTRRRPASRPPATGRTSAPASWTA